MNPAATSNEKIATILKEPPLARDEKSNRRSKILAATIDSEVRICLAEAFKEFSFDAIWLKSVEAARNVLSKEKIDACFCGFWLQDGTYRQLVSQIRHMRVDTPVIIVSGPACPVESREFLAAMNLGSIDFLAYPYRASELERIFSLAKDVGLQSARRDSNLIDPAAFASEAA